MNFIPSPGYYFLFLLVNILEDGIMVKQDYLVRMIQEIISAIARAILNKKKIRQQDRDEYDLLTRQMLGFPVKELTTMDVQELIDRYANEEDRIGKIELASVYLLRFSEEVEDDILLKSKLRQDGIRLLKYVQQEDTNFSIQRDCLIRMLETNQ